MINIGILTIIGFGVLLPASIQAAVFGDANSQNGIEDQRLARHDAGKWPAEFKSVGRIYCDGSVQGSAILFQRGNVETVLSPGLLTAKHVIENFDISRCAFAPESDTWRRAEMISVSVQGVSKSSSFIASRYSGDWAVIEILPWEGWRQYALGKDAMNFSAGNSYSKKSMSAHMVGFDLLSNKMVAHLNCQFGFSEQSDLLSGFSGLYWDNCDSTQGGSGGALFMEDEGNYKLVGLRVGSLFDESVVGQDPEMGSEFDINASINVSKAVSSEMFEPVCTFAETGCEPVGNTGTLVEN